MLLNCSVGEDSWESLGLQGDPTSLKGNQPGIFVGWTDAEAPILWPPDVWSWLIGKDPAAGKDGEQEEKGLTEDEMVRWHHWVGHDLATEQRQHSSVFQIFHHGGSILPCAGSNSIPKHPSKELNCLSCCKNPLTHVYLE